MVLILFFRSLLFSLYFYISVIVFTLFFVFLSLFIEPRKRYVLTSWYISTLLMVLKFICRIDWVVEGDILGKKPVVIASNHQGLWESFYLQTLMNPLTTIIKNLLQYIIRVAAHGLMNGKTLSLLVNGSEKETAI